MISLHILKLASVSKKRAAMNHGKTKSTQATQHDNEHGGVAITNTPTDGEHEEEDDNVDLQEHTSDMEEDGDEDDDKNKDQNDPDWKPDRDQNDPAWKPDTPKRSPKTTQSSTTQDVYLELSNYQKIAAFEDVRPMVKRTNVNVLYCMVMSSLGKEIKKSPIDETTFLRRHQSKNFPSPQDFGYYLDCIQAITDKFQAMAQEIIDENNLKEYLTGTREMWPEWVHCESNHSQYRWRILVLLILSAGSAD